MYCGIKLGCQWHQTNLKQNFIYVNRTLLKEIDYKRAFRTISVNLSTFKTSFFFEKNFPLKITIFRSKHFANFQKKYWFI